MNSPCLMEVNLAHQLSVDAQPLDWPELPANLADPVLTFFVMNDWLAFKHLMRLEQRPRILKRFWHRYTALLGDGV
jgi:hypothetical protein